MLDAMDRKILALLQTRARMSNAEVARQVGMVPSGTFERIRKLEDRGVIARYEARVNPVALGRGLLAFVFLRSKEQPGELGTAEELAKIPDVLEVHNIAGEDCFLLKVRARDPQDLARIIREKIGVIKSVTSTRTTIALETIKETSVLPLEESSPAKIQRRRLAS